MNYLQTVVEYVEGRMSFEEFDSLLCADADFARWIEKSAPGDWRCFTLATADNNYKPEELPFTIRQ